MPVTILFIGDPHIQVNNIIEVDMFIKSITTLAKQKKPDIICIGGDTLHTHERLHTTALNKAYELINNMRLISKTYVLVGNHDMLNNQVFLNDNHWLNGLKEWDNTVIVDKVIDEKIKGEKLIFVPYVPPGRFEEALNTLEENWKDASCIFAHQEFAGCKMGAIISVEGDKWPVNFPHVISGHIHSRQIPQRNIYYTGSALQHAFGESEKNIIAYLTVYKNNYEREEIDLKLPRKKIIYMDVEDLDDYKVPNTDDKIKLTLSGNYDQFKALKKTKQYKDLLKEDIKIVFKPKKLHKNQLEKTSDNTDNNLEENISNTDTDFTKILSSIITDQRNPYLAQAFELIVNGKKSNIGDFIFL
jgi:DNA repair exonuclease SbcCD nuclease subunit